jgi:hypothetical protein
MPRPARLVAIVAVLGLLVAACSEEGGSQGVRDADRSMFVEVPGGWTVFEADTLTEDIGTPFVTQDPDFVLPVLSRIVFSQAADTSQITTPSAANVPVGSATVRSITAAQKEQLSRLLMSQSVVPYSDYPASQVFLNEDIEVADDFDGIQVIVAYNDPNTDTDAAVSFVSVTDPAVTKLYTIAVGCSLDCFGQNQATINEIVDSWLVNTR